MRSKAGMRCAWNLGWIKLHSCGEDSNLSTFNPLTWCNECDASCCIFCDDVSYCELCEESTCRQCIHQCAVPCWVCACCACCSLMHRILPVIVWFSSCHGYTRRVKKMSFFAAEMREEREVRGAWQMTGWVLDVTYPVLSCCCVEKMLREQGFSDEKRPWRLAISAATVSKNHSGAHTERSFDAATRFSRMSVFYTWV